MRKLKNFIIAPLVILIAGFIMSLDLKKAEAGLTQAIPFYPQAFQGVHLFDDFVTGLVNINFPISSLGWGFVANGGGGILGANIGSVPNGVVGRVGILAMSTGSTSNATGQPIISLPSAAMYAGQAAYTIQWSLQVPTTLSTSGVEYGIEGGIGTYPYENSGNGIGIQYVRTVSTNWSGYSINNGTNNTTPCTTSDSAHFAVTAGAWYNFKIVMPIAGTSASLYVAPGGSQAYVLLCTISDHLPDISNQAYPFMDIYKISSTTTPRVMNVDWFQLDATFAANR